MIPLIVVGIYLVIIAVIGSVAFRRGKENTEDFFLASRTIGPMVFFLSIFATNMTAFAILGSSGVAYRRGIGIFGMMASSSGIVIPLTIFLIGTRIWSLGKRFGHQTQVALFRDRWECSGTGTAIFCLSAAMLIPYMIISIIGGGRVLADISEGMLPYWAGCLIVTFVVTLNVFLGGMRGVVWVNIFQTILFLLFGAVALAVVNANVPGGIHANLTEMLHAPKLAPLLTRERIPELEFFSYFFIPLSSIMFPHMSIMCLSARKMSAFKRTVVLYPLAIMAIWLPCVFLGVLGAKVLTGPPLASPDGVLLHLLTQFAPAWLAGILGAGIISAVMGSDCHQVLALSTMFTKDIFEHYGGHEKFGEKGSVLFARGFILLVTGLAFVIALRATESIFTIAIRFAFSGFAAMAPIMVAALFWKRSTKWGALASTFFVAFCVIGQSVVTNTHNAGDVVLQVGSTPVIFMTKPPVPKGGPGARGAGAPGGERMAAGGPGAAHAGAAKGGPAAGSPAGAPGAAMAGGPGAGAEGGRPGAGGPAAGAPGARGEGGAPAMGGTPKPPPFNPDVRFLGFMTVVPMVIGSALFMLIGSLLSAPPSQKTIDRYFPPARAETGPAAAGAGIS